MHQIRQDSFDKLIATGRPPADQEWNNLPVGAKLLIAYNWEKSPIHDRRTLDQALYYTLPAKDIRERDKDQVLYRYMKIEDELKDNPRILMVDQLWIWISDTPTKGADGTNCDTSMIPAIYVLS